MGKKKIDVKCWGYIAHPKAQSLGIQVPWEDIWISWKDGPGKKRKAGPCVIGLANLKDDIEVTKRCIDDARSGKASKPPKGLEEIFPADESFAECIPGWEEELKTDTAMLEELTSGRSQYVIRNYDRSFDILVNKEFLTRSDIEDALAWWLKKYHNISNPKFCWRKVNFYIRTV